MHMFHTLTDVQSGAPISLLRCIDNREDNLCIGLRSISYTVGWYNVGPQESISWRPGGSTEATETAKVTPGLYRFAILRNFINRLGVNLSIRLDNVTNRVVLRIPVGWEVQFTDGLLSLLGLDDGLHGEWLNSGTYTGDHSIGFAGLKKLHVYVEQLSTTGNFVDGAPSTLLTTVGVGLRSPLGAIETIRFENLELKRLTDGLISELKVSICDDYGKIVDNHGQPISVVLEIC